MLRSRIGLSVSAALLLGMAGIAGCANYQNTAGNYGVRSVNDGVRVSDGVRVNDGVRGVQDGRLNVNSVRDGHTIDRLSLDQKLADRVAAMKEVRTANVLTSGRSAYVAVTLENNVTGGMRAKGGNIYGTDMLPGSTGYGTGYGTGYSTGVGPNYPTRGTSMPGAVANNNRSLTGAGAAIPGPTGTGAAIPGPTGTGAAIPGPTGTGAAIPGPTGIGAPGPTGRGGFLPFGGVTTGTGAATVEDVLTKEVKAKIANVVKKNAHGIDRVYVSANPDFVQRVNSYAAQARAGHPLQGFVNEFRVLAERIFPVRTGDYMHR
ncbi:YhcN/YlaJ family sporulation lipoprotein [Paenibacillus durus]|uniref:YhcN/YlaJ family sporulation lipoprotein n=1 Tax=Paenibacillus durus TaxID=44251 RepID=UPI000472CB60|nr:YhcN/YlaJ family sporulation lipoprotein [Paenibacillus durus]